MHKKMRLVVVCLVAIWVFFLSYMIVNVMNGGTWQLWDSYDFCRWDSYSSRIYVVRREHKRLLFARCVVQMVLVITLYHLKKKHREPLLCPARVYCSQCCQDTYRRLKYCLSLHFHREMSDYCWETVCVTTHVNFSKRRGWSRHYLGLAVRKLSLNIPNKLSLPWRQAWYFYMLLPSELESCCNQSTN